MSDRNLQPVAPQTQQPAGALDSAHQRPEVLFIDEVAKRLGMTRRTIERRIHHGAFPIPELDRLDHHRRWSSVDVDEYIANRNKDRRAKPVATGGPRLAHSRG